MQVAYLQQRMSENTEVVEALKTQLVDYKAMTTMLQGQLRRGKNKTAGGVVSVGGAAALLMGGVPAARLTHQGGGGGPEGSMELGDWPGGVAGGLDTPQHSSAQAGSRIR